MVEVEDFQPDWDESPEKRLDPGTYIWQLKIVAATYQNLESDKPYMKVEAEVVEGPIEKFEFRIYLTKASKWKAHWFLKKFGYPPELLDSANPVIRRSLVVGLQGKAQVAVTNDDKFGYKIEAEAFERLAETELEDKLYPADEVALAPADGDGAAIDLEADVKAEDPFAVLDEIGDSRLAHRQPRDSEGVRISGNAQGLDEHKYLTDEQLKDLGARPEITDDDLPSIFFEESK